MSRLARALAIAALCIPFGASAQVAENVGVDVAYVASGGSWHDGRNTGTYRLVVLQEGIEHTATSAFAQWIALADGGKPRIVSSRAVDAVRRDLSGVIINVRYEHAVADAGVFVLDVRDRNSGAVRSVRVRLRAPGEIEADRGGR